MNYLLLVAHGSRVASSNEEIRQLTNKLAQCDHGFDEVGCAFLELDTPSIPDGIRAAIAKGAKKVVVLPYFLAAGKHVKRDIPNAIKEVQIESTNIKITQSNYIGAHPNMAQWLANMIKY